jgi:hypothetical protein
MSNMKCCICLNTQEGKYIKNPVNHYRCPTCEEGLVCTTCIRDFDPTGVCYLVFKDEIIDTIRCPCCRTLNWTYYYDCFVSHFQYETEYEAPDFIADNWRTGKNDKVLDILVENIMDCRFDCENGIRCEECTYCVKTRPCECGCCEVVGGTCEEQMKIYEEENKG